MNGGPNGVLEAHESWNRVKKEAVERLAVASRIVVEADGAGARDVVPRRAAAARDQRPHLALFIGHVTIIATT